MFESDHADLEQALGYIDPATLDYQEWLEVGMALHESGLPCSLWDEWSRRDPERYHEGECARKWSGFGSGDGRVRSGTVAKMARDRGWLPGAGGQPDEAMGWDDLVSGAPSPIVDSSWIEGVPVAQPTDAEWDPAGELVRYLGALFDEDDRVGYVTRSFERDGRWIPADKGVYTRTAGEIIAMAKGCGGDLGAAIGDWNPEAGAWIRFNPLDGRGVRNANVTEFRYALVESDSLPVEKQHEIMLALELPIAALVDSGNKSLHAIVRVDAADYAEYRKRVDRLYEVCRKNGLEPDVQNKNPSRLSRMPGVRRGGRKQHLVATGIGKRSWDEWWEWVQEVQDDLPDPEGLDSVWDDMPELAPPLIDGVLRRGHKMLLAGPSKAGKSFALIELCCAIAEGREWLGWRCARGRVLYVNLELDRASCLHRFRDVYGALGWEPGHLASIDVWNLRGKSVPMDRLAPKLIRRANRKGYDAVVIDPIYKVITGDENSADQMAAFCNQFDLIAAQLGCAVIYCHHHSKGFQGQKRSMDRASGSGVFARDPDALLDMTELHMTDECRGARATQLEWVELQRIADERDPGWRERAGMDPQNSPMQFMAWASDHMPEKVNRELLSASQAVREASRSWTAWRIDGTLREFPKFEPVNLWFDYPTHAPDADGSLSDLSVEGEPAPWGERQRNGSKSTSDKYAKQRETRFRWILEKIYPACEHHRVTKRDDEGNEIDLGAGWAKRADIQRKYDELAVNASGRELRDALFSGKGGNIPKSDAKNKWQETSEWPFEVVTTGKSGAQTVWYRPREDGSGEPIGWGDAVRWSDGSE